MFVGETKPRWGEICPVALEAVGRFNVLLRTMARSAPTPWWH